LDITRLRIVLGLASGAMNVTQIGAAIGCSQPVTSNHLAQLRMRGVVTNQRRAKEVFYTLAPTINVHGKMIVFTLGEQTLTIARP
jgi:ArsR family transcriptional regulator